MRRVLLLAAFLVLVPPDALGTQEHGDPEGLYSHQIAHLFFILTMVVLVVQIRRSSPRHRGWRCIGIAAVLFLAWNIDTFAVHFLRESMPSELFSGSAERWDQRLDITTLRAKLYYAGKIFDHVFLIGAVGMFTKGIKSFSDDAGQEGG